MTKHRGEYILLVAVAAFLLIVGMLTSCRTQYVPVPENHDIYVSVHDSLIYHDSIYKRDSVRVPFPVERKLNTWERTVLAAAKPVAIVVILLLSLMLLSWLRKTSHK